MVFTVNEEKRIICLFAIYESPTEDISMNITLPHALHQHFNLRSLSECGNGSKKEAGYRNFKGSIEKERGYQEPMKRMPVLWDTLIFILKIQ